MKNVIIDGVEYAPVIKQKAQIVDKHYRFELHPNNLGQLSWDEAIIAVTKLGDGWRLPTIEECWMIYKDNLLDSASYWSSTEFDNSLAWYFGFSNGSANYYYKADTYYVRAVRDL